MEIYDPAVKFRLYHTSPGGRVFGAVLIVICLLIGAASIIMAIDTLATGAAAVRLRRGGQIHLDGFWAYAYAFNGLVFGSACLSFALGGAVAALWPRRWGVRGFTLIRAGGRLLSTAAVGALVMVIAWLARSF